MYYLSTTEYALSYIIKARPTLDAALYDFSNLACFFLLRPELCAVSGLEV